MTDLDYHKLYCECFNKHLTYEKYMPVKDFLYRIVKNYKDAMGNDLDFMKELIFVCDLIIKDNNYDNLDRYADFVINIHAPWFQVGEMLRVIMFPHLMINDGNWYFEVFREMCHQVNLRFDGEKFGDLRIEEIMRIYRKYHESIPYDGINGVNGNKIIYYEKFAPIIIGYFYESNYDVHYLDSFLSKFIDNYEDIYTKGYLSGICNLDHFRSESGDLGEYQFFIHLVNNGIDKQSINIK